MKIFVILAVLLGILVAASKSENHESLVRFQNSLESFSNIVNTYRVDLDKELKSKELRNAIDLVDSSMLGFNGTAKIHLDDIRSLSSKASLTCQMSRDSVLESCVSLQSTLNLFISNIDSKKMSVSDKKVMWNMTLNALQFGSNKINESLTLLEEAQNTRNILKERLEDMNFNLKYDLMNLMRADEAKQENDSKNGLWEKIKNLWNKVVEYFSKVPQYPENVENKKIQMAKIEENMKRTTLLMEKYQNFDFSEDKTKINELSLIVSKGNENKQLIFGDDTQLQSQLIPQLNELKDNCIQFSEESSA
ncbi:uncharacterized protein Dana_GF21479 [Drosophila ananassae]|uniref:Protein TsetseEP domain-containing protein n=1 Tax=Drosophila ananassae TaxID=7217 RepID=B3MSJ0_DROAN|nr:uncharacterized protein LOC6504161 [Drosophila ananassae]EDV34745.2 uncharacterized protein Dana_GF21479 [Drosophila ananassae]